jgi:hypothetical protein
MAPPPPSAGTRTLGLALTSLGVLLAVIGASVTAATYSNARDRGGTVFVLWGPMVLGVILLVAGLRELLRSTGASRPSWHPDPTGRHQRRFWDGREWSDRVADGGLEGTDPLTGH